MPPAPAGEGPPDPATFARVGGEEFFRRLVDDFYARVEVDPLLRPLFPPSLAEGKERQFLFLCQVFGGPPRYSALHGHPRLRARHLPFPIGRRERDRWLGHMLASLEVERPSEPAATTLRDYFARASLFMVNRDDPVGPEPLDLPRAPGAGSPAGGA